MVVLFKKVFELQEKRGSYGTLDTQKIYLIPY